MVKRSRPASKAKRQATATRYGAIIDGKRGAYGVVIPDLPGCTAMGKTVNEALANAAGAAVAWAEVARADGYAVPKPRPIESLLADPEIKAELAAGGVLAVVALIVDAGRATKANLSLDAGLLQAIDDAAEARGLTRSAFITSAAKEKIAAG
jgi:predicted RNase H-like HicB family nuclease